MSLRRQWSTTRLLSAAVAVSACMCPAWEDSGEANAPAGELPVLSDAAGLSDYLREAALNHADLEAAFNRWKAALERIPQATALPDPRFNYSYYIQEVETRVGPQKQKFGIMQVFPWFGKRRLHGDEAAEAAAAAQQEYEKARLDVFYRVKTAYCDYWYLAQAIAVTREHIQLARNMEGVARTRFKTGATPNSAVVRAQVELGKLDDRLRELEALRKPLAARLNAALNRPTHRELPWPDSLPEASPTFTDQQAFQWLADSSPELRRLDHVVAKEESGTRLARKNGYPDIAIGLEYVDTDDALDPSMEDSGKDPVMATVSLNLPVWRGKYRAQAREALRRRQAAEKAREGAEKDLEADLELALYHYRDAERKMDLYGDTLVLKAKQSVQVAQQGFEAGTTTFASLVDAQRLLLEFQLAEKHAQADRAKGLAEIEMLTGTDIDAASAQQNDKHKNRKEEERK